MRLPIRACLLCSAAITFSMPAFAQDSDISEDDFVLDEVFLGKSKREVQTDTPTAQTIVDQDEINDRQASTIAELVDSVPGVTLINGATPQGSGINIRGFGANSTYGSDQKVLIQIDDADVGSEELYRIGTQLFTDPALYKRVDVIRGMSGTFEYGSGAIGGLVRLETKDASDFTGGETGFRFHQSLSFATNANSTQSSSILAWQPTEDWEFLAQYVYSSADDYSDGSGNVEEATGFNNPSWMIKAKKTFGDGDHALTFSYNNTTASDRDVPYDQFDPNSGFGNVDRDYDTRTSTLKYEYNPIDNSLINVSAILSYADQKIDQSYVAGSSPNEADPGFPYFEALLYDTNHRYETTKFTLKNVAAFSTGLVSHDLRTGIELKQRDRLDANFADGGTDDRLAIFIVDNMDFGNGLTLSPAMRYETQTIGNDSDEYDNDALMGGLSAIYEFNNGFAVFGSAAYNESLPIIDDLGTPAYMTQPEKARNYEIGFSFDRSSVFSESDTLGFKANYYMTHVWDITSYSTVDAVDLSGLEIEGSYSMQNGFYTDVNANIVDSDVKMGTAEYWDTTPADSLRVTLGKRIGNELDLSWEVVANAKMTESTTPTGSSVVHNLRATYRPEFGVLQGTELRLGLENLFDLDYRTHLASRQAAGRTVKFSLAKTF